MNNDDDRPNQGCVPGIALVVGAIFWIALILWIVKETMPW